MWSSIDIYRLSRRSESGTKKFSTGTEAQLRYKSSTQVQKSSTQVQKLNAGTEKLNSGTEAQYR